MYTTVIVDDERPQQDILTGMIKNHFPQLELAAICSSVNEGVEKISTLKPQLVFLDVVMPPFTGFDLLNRVKAIDFDVIFVTSYEQYAINAFKVSAVDYLLKPFSIEQLAGSIIKFEKKMETSESFRHLQTLLLNIKASSNDPVIVALPTFNGFSFIKTDDIIRCESDDKYTTFFLRNKTQIMVSKMIKDCEDMLSCYNFCRVHLNSLINMQHIKEYRRGEGGQVLMCDGSVVYVSRARKQNFLDKLNKI
jgi:two-component system LytT family response regulator